MKINSFGTSKVFSWDKDYFIQLITNGAQPIVKDPLLITAFQKVERIDFIPPQYKHMAYMDQDIDIGYGEKIARPTFIAQMISLMQPKNGGNYLDIGTGTGYPAMILGFVAATSGHVYTIERVQWFWEMARNNSLKYPKINNITFLYRDGMEGLPTKAPFDGIRVGFALSEPPINLQKQLKVNGGRLVYPTTDYFLKVVTRTAVDEFQEEMIPGYVFEKGKEGVA